MHALTGPRLAKSFLGGQLQEMSGNSQQDVYAPSSSKVARLSSASCKMNSGCQSKDMFTEVSKSAMRFPFPKIK